jgi:triacylglycerol esterase/lipase EstA (alpha/beta hydrolase family)
VSIWWLLPLLLLAGVLVFQLTCFAIALHEMLNQPEARHTRLTGPALAAALAGFAVELGGVLVMLVTWPIGFVPWRRPSRLRPGDRPPVVFVPGWRMNRACLLLMRRRLRRDGWAHAVGFNYRTAGGDLHRAAEQLRDAVERVCAETGAARVVLIGHSMGGLVCRAYLRHYGGIDRVASVITLGTAHQGTKLCALSTDPMLQDLRPECSFLAELATDDPIPGKVDFTAIYSSFDHLVVPAGHGYYAGVGNIVVEGVGHNGLLWSRRVYDLVRENLEYGSARELEHPDEASAGAGPIR